MKLEIENKIVKYNKSKMLEFFFIINQIASARNEKELRMSFDTIKPNHFKIGFGGSHMWLKEDDKGKRIGIVNLNNK